MPFRPGTDEPKIELSEEEIRRIIQGDAVEPTDEAIIAEATATPTPTPTPTPQEAFDSLRPEPVTAQPSPPSPQAAFKGVTGKIKDLIQTGLGSLTMLEDAAEKSGLSGWGAPFYKAIHAINADEPDPEPMMGLAKAANGLQNANLQRAVGHFLPFHVPFASLERGTQENVALFTDPALLGNPLMVGWPAPIRKTLGNYLWSLDTKTPQTAAQVIATLYDVEAFQNLEPEIQDRLVRGLEIGEAYRASEFYDEEEQNKVRDEILREAVGRYNEAQPRMGMVEILALAALPFAPIAALAILGPTAAAPTVQTKIGEINPTLGKVAVAFSYLASGGVAGLAGGPKAAKALTVIFSPAIPELAANVLNPDIPTDERFIAAFMLGLPAVAHAGSALSGRGRRGPSARAERDFLTEFHAAKERGELLDAFTVEEGKVFYRGTTREGFNHFNDTGQVRGKDTWGTAKERVARDYGEAVIEFELRPNLRLLTDDSRTGVHMAHEAALRTEAEYHAADARGEAHNPTLFNQLHMEMVRDAGYDGYYIAAREIIHVFDSKSIWRRGKPDPNLPTENQIAEAYAGELIIPDTLEGPAGLGTLPDLPTMGDRGKTPAAALADARASLDWLGKSNLFLSEHLPGYWALAQVFSSGQRQFRDALWLGVEEHATATRVATFWSTFRGNYFRNLFHDTFGDFARRTDAIGMEGTSTLAVKLADGRWYPWRDVSTSPSKYPMLIMEQRNALRQYDAVQKKLLEWQQDNGLRPIKPETAEEIHFPRRVVTEEAPPSIPVPRRPGRVFSTEKHRAYERAVEGEKKGVEYTDDIAAVLRDDFYAKIMSVADKNLQNWVDFFGETQRARMETLYGDLVRGVEKAKRDVPRIERAMRNRLNVERDRAAASVRTLEKQRARQKAIVTREEGKHRIRTEKQRHAVERITLTRAREKLVVVDEALLQARETLKQTPKATNTRVKNSEEVLQARARLHALKMDYDRAWSQLFQHVEKKETGLGGKLRTIRQRERLVGPEVPIAQGRIMNVKDYNTLRQAFQPVDMGIIGNFLMEAQAPFRAMWASLDNSAAMLTLGLVMEAHPAAWGNIMALSAKSYLRGGFFERWVLSQPGLLERATRYGTLLRINELMRAGGRETRVINALQKAPLLGKALRASDFMFTTTGDLARLYLWRLWEGSWRRGFGEKGLYQLADHINRITGVTKAGHPIEALVLFAPKFFRSMLSVPANVVRGGAVGHGARMFMARFFATATFLTVLGNSLQGRPYNVNILDIGLNEKEREGRPPPFAIRTGSGYVRLFGPEEPIATMFARIFRGEPKEVVTRSLRGKLGPAGEEITNWISGRDFMGEKVPDLKNPRDVLRYIGENMAPFAAKQMIEQVEIAVQIEGELTPKTLAMAAPNVIGEFMGVRATPQFINETINERARFLVEQVRAGEFQIDKRLKADIEEHGDEYFVWGNLPTDIKQAFEEGDESISRLIDLREKRGLAQETEFSHLVNLGNEQSVKMESLGEALDQGWKFAPDGITKIPYAHEDYKRDVDALAAETRIRMDEYKQAAGIEDELDENAPLAARLMEEYITTVVEPSIDPLSSKLDGEIYEQLYNEMSAKHEGEEYAPGVSIMERVDMLLTAKTDAHYREMKSDMQKLRPYFEMRDSAWTPEFIELDVNEIDWIDSSMAIRYRTPQEFMTALVNQLTSDLSVEGDNTGFGGWGEVMFSEEDELTFADKYGAQPSANSELARAIAVELVDKVIKPYWMARSDATKQWFRDKHADDNLLALAAKWGVYDVPPILFDILE